MSHSVKISFMRYRKTNIVCTIGPSSWAPEMLQKLAESGMDVARLNFSHGSHEEKAEQIENIRKISQKLKKPIAILADLQGPKLRVGQIDGKRDIKKGEKLRLVLIPNSFDEIPLQFDLSPFVKKGQRIFLNDGLVEVVVESVNGKTINAKATNDGWISSNKGVNVPDTEIRGAGFTDKDFKDAEFALKQGVDYLALSFVQTADDLKKARELIKQYRSKAKIIVKVEKKKAVENLEEIIKATDAVMVARGDLGIEIPGFEVPIIQKKMIHLARQNHKPVIVATQMLESMVENPRPTRAEISDVANAVMDQADAVMLSAESASGKYPAEAVKVMNDVICHIEENLEYKHYIKINWDNMPKENITSNAITSSAASIAYRLQAKAIIVGTVGGKTAYSLASFRPDSLIIAVTHDQTTYNQLGLNWGTIPFIVEPTETYDDFLKKILELIKKNDIAKKDDQVVIITGSAIGVSGTTDTIKITKI